MYKLSLSLSLSTLFFLFCHFFTRLPRHTHDVERREDISLRYKCSTDIVRNSFRVVEKAKKKERKEEKERSEEKTWRKDGGK